MSQSAASIYQLKITLKGSKPPIWRRVQVPSDITLATLHEIMQIVMGWTDSHLHQFKSGNMYYGLPDRDETGDLAKVEDEAAVTVSRVLRRPQAKLLYEYDFGDNWQHDIVLEQILQSEPGRHYPVAWRANALAHQKTAAVSGGMVGSWKRFR